MGKRNPQDRMKEQMQSYSEQEPEKPPMEEERYEIIEGIRYDFLASPVVAHQKILAAIYLMVYESCDLNGTILFAPIDVYLDEDNQFQPDLVYILHENESIITEQRIEGAPNLVAEVLSPSTSENDKIRKKRQYERHGVQEYWIVDPVHKTVDQFVLREGSFSLYETYGIRDRVVSPVLSCIDLEGGRLFAGK